MSARNKMKISDDAPNSVPPPAPSTSNGDVIPLPKQKHQHRRRSWWRRLLTFFTIEPLTFLYGISSVVASVYFTEQIKLRVCQQELGYNATICDMVGLSGDHPGLEAINAQVQKRWAMWVLYQRLVSCLPAAIITAFAGAWSDNFGRKPPMVLVLIGLSISSLFGLWFVWVPTLPLYVTLFYALFTSLFGNWSIMLLCIVAYIADVSTDATRTVRIAIAEGGIGVGAVFGAILASVLIKMGLPQVTMIITLVIHLLSLMFVVFAVRETRAPASIRERMEARYPGAKLNAPKKFAYALSHLFTLDNLREAYATAQRRRPHHIRLYILLCTIAMFFFTVQITGEQEVMQEYFEFPPISWTYSQYQHYVSGFGVVEMVALFAVFFILVGYFKIRDTIIMILGAVSCFTRAIIMIGAHSTTVVYVASSIGLFKYVGAISFRVCVSKLVGREEQGRGFALIAIAETLAPLAGNVVYATLLTGGIDWKWTNAIFVASAVDTGLRLLCAIVVCIGTWQFYGTWNANSKTKRPSNTIAAITGPISTTAPIGHQPSRLEPRASLSGKALHDLIVSGIGSTETELSSPNGNNHLEPHIGFVGAEAELFDDDAKSSDRHYYNSIDDIERTAARSSSSHRGPTPAQAVGGVALNAVFAAAGEPQPYGEQASSSEPSDEEAPPPPNYYYSDQQRRSSSFVTEHSVEASDDLALGSSLADEANNYNERRIE